MRGGEAASIDLPLARRLPGRAAVLSLRRPLLNLLLALLLDLLLALLLVLLLAPLLDLLLALLLDLLLALLFNLLSALGLRRRWALVWRDWRRRLR